MNQERRLDCVDHGKEADDLYGLLRDAYFLEGLAQGRVNRITILGVGPAARKRNVAGMGGHRVRAFDEHHPEIVGLVLEQRHQHRRFGFAVGEGKLGKELKTVTHLPRL